MIVDKCGSIELSCRDADNVVKMLKTLYCDTVAIEPSFREFHPDDINSIIKTITKELNYDQ